MGDVYLALDTRLGRRVALKILPSQYTADAYRLYRFQKEARAASGLNHPNILVVYEMGEADGRYFIATEFVEGRTLREVINEGKLELPALLDIAIQVTGALGAPHEARKSGPS